MDVLVLGGGYGGLTLARRLLRGPAVAAGDLTLVDRLPFHTVKTELYRLAAGSAAAEDVTLPFPHAVYLHFRQGTVERLEAATRTAWVDGRPLQPEVLVLALGSEVQTFGVPGVTQHALSLEGYPEAVAVRARIASLPARARVVIAGAGLTGVELAAEVRQCRPELEVVVLEAAAAPVPAFPEHIRDYVRETLLHAGADVRCGEGVAEVRAAAVVTSAGAELASDLTVWAAGVRPRAVIREAGLRLGRGERVVVDAAGNADGFPGILVVGDAALAPYPPSAQLAKRQGAIAAAAVAARVLDRPFVPAPVRLSGVVAALGTREGFSTLFRRDLVGGPARQLKTLVEWLYRWQARP